MSKRILIVDDEVELVDMMTVRLQDAGYEVETANNGREGLGAYIESLHKTSFSLILLDIMMPGIDGQEVLGIIRKEEELRGVAYGNGIPIIMLTAVKDKWIESFKAGCDDYIIKPFEVDGLLKKIEGKLQ